MKQKTRFMKNIMAVRGLGSTSPPIDIANFTPYGVAFN